MITTRVCARCGRQEGSPHDAACRYWLEGSLSVQHYQTVVGLPASQPVDYDGGMVQPDDAPHLQSNHQVAYRFEVDGMNEEQKTRAAALAEWWMSKAAAEVEKMVPKAIAYGSSDLKVMGAAMHEIYPQLRDVVDGQELAIWFYVQGKVARLIGGYAQGELPDVDSWWDLKVYAAMAQHVREFGGW